MRRQEGNGASGYFMLSDSMQQNWPCKLLFLAGLIILHCTCTQGALEY